MRLRFAMLLAAAMWLAHARWRKTDEPIAEAAAAEAPITNASARERPAPTRITNAATPARSVAPRPALELPDEPPKLVELPPPLPSAGPLALHGRIYGLDGEPVVDASVLATSPSGTTMALTDETGYVRVVADAPTTYVVDVYYGRDVMHAGTYSVGRHAAAFELVFEPPPVVDVGGAEKTTVATGRTFGGALGAPGDEPLDVVETLEANRAPARDFRHVLEEACGNPEGCSFSSRGLIENTYVENDVGR